MRCSNCGGDSHDDASECEYCGDTLPFVPVASSPPLPAPARRPPRQQPTVVNVVNQIHQPPAVVYIERYEPEEEKPQGSRVGRILLLAAVGTAVIWWLLVMM